MLLTVTEISQSTPYEALGVDNAALHVHGVFCPTPATSYGLGN